MQIIKWIKDNKIFILFFFFILAKGLIWTWSIPPFFVSDELPHFAYAQYLVEEKEIPKNTGKIVPLVTTMSEELEKTSKLLQERHMIASLKHMDFSDNYEPVPEEFNAYSRKNVKENYKNSAAIYSPFYYAIEAIPYVLGYNLDIFARFYLMRAFSLIFLFIIIVFVYKTALLVSEDKSFAIIAAAIVALTPSINSSLGGINNDAALIAFSHIIFYLLFMTLKNPNLKTMSVIGNGALLGLALLTKPQAVIFIPLTIGVFLYKGFRENKKRQALFALFTILFTALIVAAPFYIDPIKYFFNSPNDAEDLPQKILSAKNILAAINYDIRRIASLFQSFWMQAQIFNIFYPSYIGSLIYALELFGLIGLVDLIRNYFSNKKQSNKTFYAYIALCVTSLIALELFYSIIYFKSALTNQYYNFAMNGRYYLLIIGPLTILLLFSLRHFFYKLKIPTNALYIGLLLFFLFLHNYALFNIILQYNYL